MAKIECPACYFEFEAEEGLIEGEVISCPDCGVDLEIVKIDG
ncbi:MAG: lysine biosynthesis protein LysW, partial [Promethearchaeota archaeon]